MEILNNMNLIHDKKLNTLFESNLLHDIIIPQNALKI